MSGSSAGQPGRDGRPGVRARSRRSAWPAKRSRRTRPSRSSGDGQPRQLATGLAGPVELDEPLAGERLERRADAASSCVPIGASMTDQPLPAVRPQAVEDAAAEPAAGRRERRRWRPRLPGRSARRRPSSTRAAYRHQDRTGQPAQSGRRGGRPWRQVHDGVGPVARTGPREPPRRRAPGASARSSAAGSPAVMRPMTRRTLVSTAPTRLPNAIAATARAVYGPTPGSASSASIVGRDPAAVVGHDRPGGPPQVRWRAGCTPGPATRAGRRPGWPRRAPRPSGSASRNRVQASPPGRPGSAAPSPPRRARRTGRQSRGTGAVGPRGRTTRGSPGAPAPVRPWALPSAHDSGAAQPAARRPRMPSIGAHSQLGRYVLA